MSFSVIGAVERITRLRKRLDAARASRDASPVDLLRIQVMLLKAQQRIADALAQGSQQHALVPVRATRHQDKRFA